MVSSISHSAVDCQSKCPYRSLSRFAMITCTGFSKGHVRGRARLSIAGPGAKQGADRERPDGRRGNIARPNAKNTEANDSSKRKNTGRNPPLDGIFAQICHPSTERQDPLSRPERARKDHRTCPARQKEVEAHQGTQCWTNRQPPPVSRQCTFCLTNRGNPGQTSRHPPERRRKQSLGVG